MNTPNAGYPRRYSGRLIRAVMTRESDGVLLEHWTMDTRTREWLAGPVADLARGLFVLALIVGLSVGLSGCGGGSDATAAPIVVAPPQVVPPPVVVPPPPPPPVVEPPVVSPPPPVPPPLLAASFAYMNDCACGMYVEFDPPDRFYMSEVLQGAWIVFEGTIQPDGTGQVHAGALILGHECYGGGPQLEFAATLDMLRSSASPVLDPANWISLAFDSGQSVGRAVPTPVVPGEPTCAGTINPPT